MPSNITRGNVSYIAGFHTVLAPFQVRAMGTDTARYIIRGTRRGDIALGVATTNLLNGIWISSTLIEYDGNNDACLWALQFANKNGINTNSVAANTLFLTIVCRPEGGVPIKYLPDM
jgi:hypothetical protein